MASLNLNNFLRWDGEFNDADFEVLAADDDAEVFENIKYVDIPILDNDSATFGIDETSIQITQQDNEIRPAIWDASSKLLRYYLPDAPDLGIHELKYLFYDTVGNISNEATINVNVLARATGWEGYEPSKSCTLSGGVNTGTSSYAQLVKIYLDDGTQVVPQVLKANTVGDPDYIAPADDFASCPLPTMTAQVRLYNTYTDPAIKIERLEFQGLGGSPTVYFIEVRPFEEKSIYVVPTTYTEIWVYGTSVTPAGEVLMTRIDAASEIKPYVGGVATLFPTIPISEAAGADITLRPQTI